MAHPPRPSAEYQRARAARFQQAGLCRCGKPPTPGGALCPKCLDKVRRYTPSRRQLENNYKARGLCYCGRQPDPGFVRCAKCRAKSKTYDAKRVERLDANKLCRRCGAPRDGPQSCCTTCRRNQRERVHKKYISHKDEILFKGRLQKAAMRSRCISAYGGKCVCCGESEQRFLTLDHVQNDGAAHRKEIGGGGWTGYRWAEANGYPPNLQLMCYNCNMGRALSGGICPHKAKSSLAYATTSNSTT